MAFLGKTAMILLTILVPIFGYRDCANFPFFLHSKSALLASHAKLVSGHDLNLYIGPPKKDLSEFVDLNLAAGCMVETANFERKREVTLTATMVGPDGYHKVREETCYYRTVSDLIEGSWSNCDPFSWGVHFPVPSCGLYNLTFSSEEAYLGSRLLTLPVYSHLKQVQSGHTWAELAFPEHLLKYGDCNHKQNYKIKCGNIKKIIKEKDKSIRIENLFPGSSYKCSMLLENGHFDQTYFYIETKPKSLDSVTFAATDKMIYLVKDDIDLLLDPDMISEVTIRDITLNFTLAFITAKEAMISGVQGLEPAKNYQACLTLRQQGANCPRSPCQSQKWCRKVTTLPLMPGIKTENPLDVTFVLMFVLITPLLMLVPVGLLACVSFLNRTGSKEPSAPPATAPSDVIPHVQ